MDRHRVHMQRPRCKPVLVTLLTPSPCQLPPYSARVWNVLNSKALSVPRTSENFLDIVITHDNRGLCYGLKLFFDPNHLKNTLRVIFRKTEDNRPKRLIILMIAVCIIFGPMYGEGAILYLSTRYRFNWDEVQFSLFQTYILITGTGGTVLGVILFAKILNFHDSVLGLIACASKIASAFVFCFAATGAMFYLAPVIDMFSNVALIAIRSTFSKQVDPDELGKLNSIVGLFENLMPFVYVSMYTTMYTATIGILPGAVFLLGAVLTLPAVGVFIWLYIRHKRGYVDWMAKKSDQIEPK